MTWIWILVSVGLLANIYALLMIYGLKGIIKDNDLKYEYTDKGIVFYDKTGKKTLIKGEEL